MDKTMKPFSNLAIWLAGSTADSQSEAMLKSLLTDMKSNMDFT